MGDLLKPTPWDRAAFGVPTWELLEYSTAALRQAAIEPGHYTLKVDPLANKSLLQEHGFYYCDTLIEPRCDALRLRTFVHINASISKVFDKQQALEMCHGAFSHGRFHRDFNLKKAAADHRYDTWLSQMVAAQQVFGLFWQGTLAGFIAYNDNCLALHALAKEYRGKGMSKYWWSAVCKEVLALGNSEVRSSISVTNLPVLNLYASLGFTFSKPQDIYHRFIAEL